MFNTKKIEQQNKEIIERLDIIQKQQEAILSGLFVIGQDVVNLKDEGTNKNKPAYFG